MWVREESVVDPILRHASTVELVDVSPTKLFALTTDFREQKIILALIISLVNF